MTNKEYVWTDNPTVSGVSKCDTDILNAIRYHTVGHLNMSFLEKCIFLADYLEPSRDFPAKPTLSTTQFFSDKLCQYIRTQKNT